MTARTGRRESTCTHCGKPIRTGTTACSHHADLVNIEPEALAICTVSDDCAASADGHLPECPVEQRLQDTFGF